MVAGMVVTQAGTGAMVDTQVAMAATEGATQAVLVAAASEVDFLRPVLRLQLAHLDLDKITGNPNVNVCS